MRWTEKLRIIILFDKIWISSTHSTGQHVSTTQCCVVCILSKYNSIYPEVFPKIAIFFYLEIGWERVLLFNWFCNLYVLICLCLSRIMNGLFETLRRERKDSIALIFASSFFFLNLAILPRICNDFHRQEALYLGLSVLTSSFKTCFPLTFPKIL